MARGKLVYVCLENGVEKPLGDARNEYSVVKHSKKYTGKQTRVRRPQELAGQCQNNVSASVYRLPADSIK